VTIYLQSHCSLTASTSLDSISRSDHLSVNLLSFISFLSLLVILSQIIAQPLPNLVISRFIPADLSLHQTNQFRLHSTNRMTLSHIISYFNVDTMYLAKSHSKLFCRFSCTFHYTTLFSDFYWCTQQYRRDTLYHYTDIFLYLFQIRHPSTADHHLLGQTIMALQPDVYSIEDNIPIQPYSCTLDITTSLAP